ncbi:MAG: (d)CMP kinase [Chloroflexi bacterium]|nr:(d)CMP kinase [Chloroflexota bacterium]
MGEPAIAAEAHNSAPACHAIAVDGSAASGKSTVGQRLAADLGYPFLDTGIMYRAMTVVALDRQLDISDEGALGELVRSVEMRVELAVPSTGKASKISVDGVDVTDRLRSQAVEDAVSLVSQIQAIRKAMVALQREIAGRQPVVMAGRDIGTVVLPDANLKIYLEASLEERARRRHQEFEAFGRDASRDAVHADLERRDRIDSERDVSPLRPANDAHVIDTDGLTMEEVLREALSLVRGGTDDEE